MPEFIKVLIYLGVLLSIGVLVSVFRLWWKKHKYERTKTEDLLKHLAYRVGTQKQITEVLLKWLRSIGVGIITDPQEGQTGEVKQDKVIGEWSSQKLAVVRVSLRRIHSIEVWMNLWQKSVQQGLFGTKSEGRSAVDLVYVVTLEPEVAVPLALHTNTITKRTFGGKIKSLEWHGFPGLRDKLEADKRLRSRIVGCLRKACELSVRRLPSDRVGIATSLILPSREMLRCIEDIAAHVSEYVTEWNRDKQKSTEQEPDNAT